MKVEIEVISTCMIKPVSPTPHHLQHHKFSFLDQVNPPVFMPLVLFYPFENDLTNLQRSNQLKKSLSDALTRFYPLAGRIMGNSYVNCNDEGIPYVEAYSGCKLLDILNDPIPKELNKFIPRDLDDAKDLIGMVIQVTFFECGGMAVGVGISHKIADALSFFMFITSWAAMSRGDGENVPYPKFEAVNDLFPARELGGLLNHSAGIMKKDDIVTRRFIFSASKIASLRDKFTNTDHHDSSHEYQTGRPPTRIEALSAFIWTRFMAATGAKEDPSKICTLLHAVNLRTRMNPPLPNYYFGNISRTAIATPSNDEDGYGIVNKVREALGNVNGDDYQSKLRQGDKHLKFITERAKRVINGEMISLNFTSLCRFPLYEADFGWGKPVWVGSARLNFKNLVVFLDTKSGNGIEAWINLKWEDMAKLEADKELLSYANSSNLDDKIYAF